jgi:4-aminobutyrate aminotransferase-like enzyme
VPLLVPADEAPGWLAHTADPAPLLDLPGIARTDQDVMARREAHVAGVQEHYYARPPRIERGWRTKLVDTGARAYLDMVNNVTSVGHAHPRITAAVSRQLRRLNTNSRFHYSALADFAEALAATLPDPLGTVFLVNSGSEATDLAIRLAMAATGRRDIVALAEAYHGWTYASDAVSTSVADNPNALGTRPDWVHALAAPNSYRGRWRDGDAVHYGPEAAAAIAALAASGRAPAGFIAEAIQGNAGGILLPEGYLAQVYAAVRDAGGFAIADEVQVGYGRLGDWFWGFEQQGVVPDIVAVAKSIGNGHPLGAVITSREIADAYRAGGYFFSSTGGSPVSATVGLTVLDIIRDEGLEANAREVGARLKAGLEVLAERHASVGTVHGHGLYLGLDVVTDRTLRTPDPRRTRDLCERLRQLGVIMQPTGDHGNVLKIKPPLVVTADDVDFFIAMVDRALSELS